jgi:CsoR family transcriptional regulator, copper-sensing transcriptional repressor
MSTDHKQQLLRRLRIIGGHVRGIERMVEADAYCIDLLNQSRAVQQALARFDQIVLAEHLRSCVSTAIAGDDAAERERVLNELMTVYASLAK